MYLRSQIADSIQWIGSSDNFSTNISVWLHIANVKKGYWSSNRINLIGQMLKHSNQCTSLDYKEETLSYLALQGWYDIDSAKVFNLLSATDKQQCTCRAHLFLVQTIEDEPCMGPAPQQVYHLRETDDREVCRSNKLTSLGDTSEDFGIPNFRQLFHTQIEEDRGHDVSGLVLYYDQNVLISSLFNKILNGLLYYH